MSLSIRTSFLFFFVIALAAQQTKPAVSSPATFDVSGVIVHALTQTPLPGTLVTLTSLQRKDQTQTVFADTNGRFVFTGIVAGKYRLTAKHKDFPPQALDAHGSLTTLVAVGPDKNSANLVFRLKPDGSIAGRVTDEEDDPLRGAKVILLAREADAGERTINPRAQAITDDQGSYRFDHLQAGTYFIAVVARPWYARHVPQAANGSAGVNAAVQANNAELDVAYPITYFPQETEPERANPIRLSFGDRIRADVTLRAVPAVHVKLTATGANAPAGIEDPTLIQTLLGGAETPVESQAADMSTNGPEIYGVAPGRYDLRYDLDEESTSPAHSGAQHQMVNAVSTSEADTGESTELVTISGTVKFEGRDIPPAGVALQFQKIGTGRRVEAPIFSGEISPIQVGSGRYRLRLLNAPGFALKAVSAQSARIAGETVEISGSNPVQLSVAVAKGTGQVEGMLLCNGQPQAGAMVVLAPQSADNLSLFSRDQSSTDGSFVFPAVVPGRYTVLSMENGWELEWANPQVLKPYMVNGQIVQVQAGVKSTATIKCSNSQTR